MKPRRRLYHGRALWVQTRADRWGWGISLALWLGVALAWGWLEISG